MASKAMWEVDPETRSKLAALQKEGKNGICCDCNAPSPQWASPKFGIFICLTCAGVHRGLGVHISFVRSISMDAFKASEIERMRLGGNAGWRKFFEEHDDTQARGLTWDDATIAERYGGEVGEEWKERLSCKVEGREFDAAAAATAAAAAAATAGAKTAARATSPASGSRAAVSASPAPGAAAKSTPRASTPRAGTPLSGTTSRSQSPGRAGKAKVDDKYFARLGADNALRRDDIPPNQGGKYSGFGSAPPPAQAGEQSDLSLEEMQKDAVAAITKGFGWFTSTVSRTAKSVNEGYIQPTASRFAEGDFARQAQLTAAQLARQAQQAGKSASDGFSRLVEGPESHGTAAAAAAGGGGGGTRQIDESHRSFWDDFSDIAAQRKPSGSAIGTSAMGMGKSRGAGGAGGGSAKPSQHDEWDDW